MGYRANRDRVCADSCAGHGDASFSPVLHGGERLEADEIRLQAHARRVVKMRQKGFTALEFDVDVPSGYSLDDYNRSII